MVGLPLGETLSSVALLGLMATVISPFLLGASGSLGRGLHEPSGATPRPPSVTPESAVGEGAVSDRMLAPRKRLPTRSRRVTLCAPGGSSSTTTK